MNRGRARGRVARPARRARASYRTTTFDRAPAPRPPGPGGRLFAHFVVPAFRRDAVAPCFANVIRIDERRKHAQTLGPRLTRARRGSENAPRRCRLFLPIHTTTKLGIKRGPGGVRWVNKNRSAVSAHPIHAHKSFPIGSSTWPSGPYRVARSCRSGVAPLPAVAARLLPAAAS